MRGERAGLLWPVFGFGDIAPAIRGASPEIKPKMGELGDPRCGFLWSGDVPCGELIGRLVGEPGTGVTGSLSGGTAAKGAFGRVGVAGALRDTVPARSGVRPSSPADRVAAPFPLDVPLRIPLVSPGFWAIPFGFFAALAAFSPSFDSTIRMSMEPSSRSLDRMRAGPRVAERGFSGGG